MLLGTWAKGIEVYFVPSGRAAYLSSHSAPTSLCCKREQLGLQKSHRIGAWALQEVGTGGQVFSVFPSPPTTVGSLQGSTSVMPSPR